MDRDIKTFTNKEINKELNFVKGYLAYLRFESSIFKDFKEMYIILKTEIKDRIKTRRWC